MNFITVKAPAKINLFLKVFSKRIDGYHNIHTLFERVSLFDTIKISKIPKKIAIKSDKFLTKNPKDNLIYKAAKAILRRGKVRTGVRIEIKKKIPIAAGLGGGSSDAAATLLGINNLFELGLNNNALASIGRSVGADVPFFLLNTSFALGKGTGDDLSIVKTRKKLWHLLIYPGFKVNTKDVYALFDSMAGAESLPSLDLVRLRSPQVARDNAKPEVSKRLTCKAGGAKIISLSMGYRNIEQMLYNDLERACVLKKVILGCILESLMQLLGKKSIVSGSGSSLFFLYSTGKEAIAAKRTILRSVPAGKRRGWQIFVVQTA